LFAINNLNRETTMAKSTKQIQDDITQRIIDSLSEGTIPWRKPWSTSPNVGTPTNIVSGKNYRGINPLLLELHRQEHDFTTKHYATFKQWRDLGARVEKRPDNVKPGEWGCSIIYYAPITKTKEDPKTGEEVPITPRRVLSFRPSNLMKEKVDAGNRR
jgi:antirestriction protein ArdC